MNAADQVGTKRLDATARSFAAQPGDSPVKMGGARIFTLNDFHPLAEAAMSTVAFTIVNGRLIPTVQTPLPSRSSNFLVT